MKSHAGRIWSVLLVSFAVGTGPAAGQSTLDLDTNEFNRVAGQTVWLDTLNGNIPIAVSNLTDVGNGLGTGFLPGWAWTQWSFMQYDAGTAQIVEIPVASKVVGIANWPLAGPMSNYYDNAVNTTANVNQTVWNIETTRDFVINSNAVITVNGGGVFFHSSSHYIKKATGANGYLTSGRADGELYVVANGGSTDYRINNVIVQNNGPTAVKLVRDGNDHLRLDAANTYSGGTLINRGRLAAGNVTAYGTGPVTVRDNNAQAYLVAAGNYSNDFNIAGLGWTEGAGLLGAIRLENNARVVGNVTLAGNARIGTYGAPVGYIDGSISGAFQLEKWGTGTLVLNNNNTYSDTLISEGTLQIGSGGTNGTLGAGIVTNFGTLAFNRIDTNTLPAGTVMEANSALSIINGSLVIPATANVANPFSLSLQNGARLDASAVGLLPNLLQLSGAGSITGGVAFAGGGTVLPGADGAVTPATAFGTLAVEGNLTLDSSGALTFDLGSSTTGLNDRITVAGDLGQGGAITINPMAVLDTNQAYKLITFTGSRFGFFGGATVPNSRYTATVDDFTVPGEVLVTFGGGPAALTWDGFFQTWEIGGSYNWNAGSELFANIDVVQFNDTATSRDVLISTNVRPGRVTVSNSLDYSFGGAGRISGYTDLIKLGAGTLNITNANDFLGDVFVSNGTLRTVNNSALGATNGATYVRGGTLNLDGRNLGREWVWIRGAGVDGTGAVINTRAAQQNALLFLGLEGDATVGGTHRFDVRGNGTWGSAILAGGTNKLTKTGPEFFVLTQGVDAQCGPIEIDQGTLSIETSSTINGDYPITVNSNGAFFMWQLAAPMARDITVNDGQIRSSSGAITQNALTGTITVNGSVTNDCAGGNIRIDGSINGGQLVKAGGNTLLLTGTNNYASTFIAAGTLQIGDYGPTGNLSPGTITNNGALRVERSDNITVTNPVIGTGNLQTYGPFTIRYNDVDVGGTLALGNNTNGPSILVISNGDTVAVNNVNVGEAVGNNGQIYQYGGVFNARGAGTGNDGNFRLGHWSTQVSTYFMEGGTLLVTNAAGRLSLGIDGTGVLNLNGGVAEITRIDVNGRSDGATDGGELRMTNGILRVGAGGIQTLGTPYTVVFAGGRLEALAGFTIAPASTLANTNLGFVLDSGANTVTQNGAMSGDGGLVKEGAGMLVLNAANTYTGGLVVSNGIVRAIGGQAQNRLAAASSVTIENGGRFEFGQVNALPTAANAVNFTIAAGGELQFTNVVGAAGEFHSHVGNLDLQGGLVSGRLSANGYNGETFVLQGDVTVGGSVASTMDLDSGVVGGMNLIRTNVFTVADVTGSAAADLVINGEAQGAGGILKLGPGTLALNGNNTYSGYTIISNGTVLVNGTTGGAGPVLVRGGTLGGTGTVSVAVTVGNDGILSPGASPGTLTLNNGLTLSSLSRMDFELGTTSDKIVVTGDLTLNGQLRITDAGGFGLGTYVLIQYTGALSGTTPTIESAPLGYDYTVDTTTQPGEVRLVVTSGSPLTPFQQWQVLYFGSTNAPNGGAADDWDGDGSNNESEFGANTNPTNSLSALKVTQTVQNGTDILLTWTTAGVRTNRVQVGTDLMTTNFVDLSGPIVLNVAGDTATNFTDAGGATNTQPRFYRIRVEP